MPRIPACRIYLLAALLPLPSPGVDAAAAANTIVANDRVQRSPTVGASYYLRLNHIVVKARTPVEITIAKEPGGRRTRLATPAAANCATAK